VNAARRIPVDPAATVFSHASISKLFVYVSVMQLVERGLLNLDNDIHEYLPADLARQLNFRHSFTMRDLLNHSAGFGENFFNVSWDAQTVESRTTLRAGLLATQPRQIFEPGTAKAYSNFGVALAAYIVGHISAMEFADFERANILEPLGMANTKNQPHWFGDNAFLQATARGHQPDGSGGFNEAPWVYLNIYPAGSLRGTAEDLARFAIALMPPQNAPSSLFNSRNTLDLMLSPSYSNPRALRGTRHGFLAYDGIYPALGHSGGLPGFNTEFVIVPSHRFGIIALSNAAGGMGVIEKIVDLLIGNSMNAVFPQADNLPDAASVAGTFVSLRRHEGNVLEVANIIMGTHMRVTAIDENTITLTMTVLPLPGMPGEIVITYRQIEPYLFRAISASSVIDRRLARDMHELYFVMENGQPVRISTSGSFDATPQTFSQSMAAFIGGSVIAYGSFVFFLIAPIVVLVKRLRRKTAGTSPFSRINNGLLFCGMLLGVNFLVSEMRMIAALSSGDLHSSIVVPHIWINYVLLALSAALFVVSLVFFAKSEIATKRRVFYFSTVGVLASFLFVLWQWNFFVMV